MVLFHNRGVSGCHNTLFLSSPHFRLTIDLNFEFVSFLCLFIDGLENLHADQIFRTYVEAKSESSDPVKLI